MMALVPPPAPVTSGDMLDRISEHVDRIKAGASGPVLYERDINFDLKIVEALLYSITQRV